jgi:hypothetical protein
MAAPIWLSPGGGKDDHMGEDVNTGTSAAPPCEPAEAATVAATPPARPAPDEGAEVGGPPGPEPTRYGDWERKGRCIDF